MNGKLLTAGDVAEIFGVAEVTARRWMREGRIPAIRVGRTIRVPEDELAKWVREESERSKREAVG